ncbi:MAG: tripartite tricarboxylate transporter substrate binding protein [Betaproteobacteria bacterium]|nr:tripartite tricarboxylate transporter substrate binding protein [Betaproteobacteria bacterium]MDH3436242.1 tripartite tricarboxylate transporter substrate binding protein [Betaproteobacteria bacterium]
MCARLLIVLVAGSVLFSSATPAQPTYPTGPVRLLVGFSPGGTTDIIARLLTPELSAFFKQQFYVDNRPGATGNIAANLAAKASPDGSTLIVVPAAFASNISAYAKTGYDPLRDFAAITRVAAVHNVLVVHPSVPAASLAELVTLAKRRPGELVFASPGNGSTPHLAVEMLKLRAGGLNVLHVPYRGMNPAVLEVLGGHVHAIVSTLPPAIAHVRSRRLRPLAVASLKRAPALPDIPTFDEVGYPGYEASAWNAVLAPAGTPYDVLIRLNLAIVQIARTPQFRSRLARLGAEVIADTPEEFIAYLRVEIAKWAKVVKASGVKIE